MDESSSEKNRHKLVKRTKTLMCIMRALQDENSS